MTIDYRAPPDDQQVTLLARTLPDGRIWNAKYDQTRVLGRLVVALSREIGRTFARIADFVIDELDPARTRQLILEWEESVGIPDVCFDRSADLTERRRRVSQKLENFGGIITREDIEGVLLDFGEEIQLVPGNEANAELLGFPAPPYDNDQLKQIKHTVAVRVSSDAQVFPLPFPFPFATEASDLLRCLLRRITPANVALQFFFNEDLTAPFGGLSLTGLNVAPFVEDTIAAAQITGLQGINVAPFVEDAIELGRPRILSGTNVAPFVEDDIDAQLAVQILDAMVDTGATNEANPGSFPVSAGENRTLAYLMCYEGNVDSISACSYGGQPMTSRAFADGAGGFPGHIRIFTLGEAGIAAATDANFSVTGDVNGRFRALAASFRNVDQASPVVDADVLTDDLSSGTIDLTSVARGFALGAAVATDSSTFDWTGITERDGTESDATMSYSGASGSTVAGTVNIDPDTSSVTTQQAAAAITLRPVA